ncbi:DNA starvation/stationary phase protection protein [Rhodobacteraceae bacterium NNCM2]|nr:DNA starvation/stationary phase protection protein [Coraliihabitans acroporae]
MHSAPTPPISPVPNATDPNLGIEAKQEIAEGLAQVLADTYQLVIKTHAYHWNVVGPLFYSVHNLTEEHYTEMFAAADEIAERMRALGALAPMNFAAMDDRSQIEAASGTPTAVEMLHDLAASHEKLGRRLQKLVEAAGGAGDPVTEDLATGRAAFHQKAAWMLRAMVQE